MWGQSFAFIAMKTLLFDLPGCWSLGAELGGSLGAPTVGSVGPSCTALGLHEPLIPAFQG